MPGHVIHLAVAEEYLRNYPNRKEAKEHKEYIEFIHGVVFPDCEKDKSITHYGKSSSFANLEKFLQDKDLSTSFNRGYFMHLMTDYLFYNRCIECFSKAIYNDYDLSNKKLMEKYKVKLPKGVEHEVFYNDGPESEMKVFTMDMICKFIEETGKLDIDEVAKEVKDNPEEWTKIRPLKCLD